MSLPKELVVHICDFLDPVSGLRLSLTSVRLWNVGFPRVLMNLTQHLGLWAGSRILHLDGYGAISDLPPGLLTKEEAGEVGEGLTRAEISSSNFHFRSSSTIAKTLYAITYHWYRTIGDGTVPWLDLSDPFEWIIHDLRKVVGKRPLSAEYPRQILSGLSNGANGLIQDDTSWVLRNLTTLEFARSEDFEKAFRHTRAQSSFKDGPRLSCARFGNVLIRAIEMGRGVKLGHRFDICTLLDDAS